MALKDRFKVIGILIFVGLMWPVAIYADECSYIWIENATQVRSETIQRYIIISDEEVIPEGNPLDREELPYPLKLKDCGFPKFYIWESADGDYLVEKAKFRCVKSEVEGRDGPVASAPGSGSGETECRN